MRSEETGEKGKVKNFETTLVAKNGDQIPVSFSGSIIYDENGTEIGSIGFFRDLREIRLPPGYFERLLESSLDIVIALDHKGQVIFYNDGAHKTLGYTSQEIHGKRVSASIYPGIEEARRVIFDYEEPLLEVTIPLGYPQAYKSALFLTGHFKTTLVRPPKRSNTPDEIKPLREFLRQKGLLTAAASDRAQQ